MSAEAHKLCADCTKGNILPGTPSGTMHSLKVDSDKSQSYYLAKGTTEGKAIIIATDIFGLGIPNAKLTADVIAKESGMSVYVPDLFDGEPMGAESLALPEQPVGNRSILEKIGIYFSLIKSVIWSGAIPWMRKWSMDVSVPKMEKFIAALKAETGATRVGMAGYCYGGTININIAPKHVVDVFVTLHAGSLKAEQFEAVDVAHCLIMADEDMGFDPIKGPTLVILERKKKEGLPIAIYSHPGTVHGSYARPLLSDPKIKQAFEEATKETADWFKEHL